MARLVPITEAGVPVPDAPADFLRFGGFAKSGVEIDAGLFVGLGKSAGFSQMDGASVIIRPGVDKFQLADKRQRAARVLPWFIG